ncbi:MAG TPA: methionyl-tRNA formyltransferase [Candidatus Acidoferrales bacterium]|nr:methionyl-tRNA formyltransferase [Candidatus Acidoferrales bacterium]
MALRIVFCGTPSFAVPSLRHLIAQPDFHVEAVVTQPDRPRGRGQEMAASAVKEAALAAGISVFQPEKIRSDAALDFFRGVAPDVVAIIAYGQIISQRLIDVPRLGWVNLHASLLPKYRGAAPINWAIVNGEARTGVTTMQIDAGLDTGPMLLRYETAIGAEETAPELAMRLAEAGAPLIAETLRALDRGAGRAIAQDSAQATFAPQLKKDDGRIDWSLDAQTIYNRIRGLQPWPGAFTLFRGKGCHIWGKPLRPVAAGGPPGILLPTQEDGLLVICGGSTVLRVEALQIEGRKRVTDAEFMNGARLAPGERFGS